jgi:transcriptional regulator with XRE-family HTH domain
MHEIPGLPRGPAPSPVGIVALRLRKAREASGLSQRALGIEAGFDPTVASPRVNQYETGKHTPDLRSLELLGKVLGKPVPYFYAVDDALAEAILVIAALPAYKQAKALELLKNFAAPDQS